MVELRLPLPPSANNLFANVPGKGRVKSARYRQWLNAAGIILKAQRPGKVEGDYVLWLWCERPDDRRRDLFNLEKPLSDLLVAHGVVGDDSECVAGHVYWRGSGRECTVQVEPASTALARPAPQARAA